MSERTCPKCGTRFNAVADYGKCTACGYSFHASQVRATPVTPRVAAADVLRLAETLSGDDPSVMNEVRLSIKDPAAYFHEFGERSPYFETVFAVDPILAAHDALCREGWVGFVDHRAEPDEVVDALTIQFDRLGVRDFDWSGIDAPEAARLLDQVAARLPDHDLRLAYLYLGWDNIDFAVVTSEQWEKIADIRGESFEIRPRFS